MKNIFFLIAVAILAGTGCGLSKTECSLSTLKIKDVKIQNDEGGYIAAAIENALFSKGAIRDKFGSDIVGTVRISLDGIPISASVRVPDKSFASVGSAYRAFSREIAAENIGRSVARDFCNCAESRLRKP